MGPNYSFWFPRSSGSICDSPGGFVVYFISALIWISILSKAELSWAFPMLSLSYVLTALLSPMVLHESFSAYRLIGTFVICLGVFLVYKTY